MRVKVLAPAYTSPAKIAQVRAYGAEVELVEGPREASQAEAIRQSAATFYASHNWQPFFLEGTKTLAYELWEDFGFDAPDAIVVPGRRGQSAARPASRFRRIAARRANRGACRNSSPRSRRTARRWRRVSSPGSRPVACEAKPTIAEGTAIKAPLRLKQMMQALRETAGEAVAVAEEEIVAALRRLCAQGLFVEPTSATAAAALDRSWRRAGGSARASASSSC